MSVELALFLWVVAIPAVIAGIAIYATWIADAPPPEDDQGYDAEVIPLDR